jgi:lipid-binding SYLF domain-containing protein
MRKVTALLLTVLALAGSLARADEYTDTINVFKNAGESAALFKTAYGYAVFPTIGKGGLGVGAAHGDGRVFAQGKPVGETSMTQVSIGLQAGGQAFSQIIFFENKAAFDQFTSGNFEFGAGVSAVAIKSGASGSVGTTGATGSASSGSGKSGAGTAGKYYKGMAVFTIAKGGLMYEASLSGQKFSFKPL